MLVFGHIASATAACHHVDRGADMRWIVGLTLVADVIDKPLGLWVFRESINNGRVWFHSLAVNLALSALVLIWQRRIVYVLAVWMHQLCDKMWTRPWVALWPLTGAFGYRDLALEDWAYHLLNPYNVVTEVLGLAAVSFYLYRYRLLRRERFAAFIRRGELTA